MSIMSIFWTILIIRIVSGQGKSLQDLLTLKSSIKWYKNETSTFDYPGRYCSICCVDINQFYRGRKCGLHTMCVYERSGPACAGLIVMDFSRNEIDVLVDAHNTLRNRIAMGIEQNGDPGPQPNAANMRLVSWDEELSQVALRWAIQCVYGHDKCRDLDRFPVGQNVAEGLYASKSDLEHIADWYDGVNYSNKDTVKKFDPTIHFDLSPFTQLIWADTYLVGCARVSFQKSLKGQVVYKEHFFCNYGPAGNIPNQPVYKIGEPCTACSEGTYCTNPEYPGLCSMEHANGTGRRKKPVKHLETSLASELKVGIAILLVLSFIIIK